VFGVRPFTPCVKPSALLPAPRSVPPLVGTRVPNASLHVTGLVVLKRNQPVVVSPFGSADPLSVAVVSPIPEAALVVTVGADGVVNEPRPPNTVPCELEPIAQ